MLEAVLVHRISQPGDGGLTIAKKKCLRNYRSQGGSTIIFVFDRSLFWDDNPTHMDFLNSVQTEFSSMPLFVDEVLLMLLFGDQKQIIKKIERTEHVASPDSLRSR
jgi:hypothetical protein